MISLCREFRELLEAHANALAPIGIRFTPSLLASLRDAAFGSPPLLPRLSAFQEKPLRGGQCNFSEEKRVNETGLFGWPELAHALEKDDV